MKKTLRIRCVSVAILCGIGVLPVAASCTPHISPSSLERGAKISGGAAGVGGAVGAGGAGAGAAGSGDG